MAATAPRASHLLDDPRLGAVLAIACLGAAAWLRLPMLERGFTSDEVSLVQPFRFWKVLTDAESGVNPPLLRLLFNMPFDGADVLVWGRRTSLVAQLGAVVLAFVAGRRLARGRNLGGLLAALPLIVLPLAVEQAARYRSYSFSLVTAYWHLDALTRMLDADAAEAPPRARFEFAVSAFLLPQWHYFWAPVLLVEGLGLLMFAPRSRRRIMLYAPAALGTLPAIWFIASETSRRVMPGDAPLDAAITTVLSLGLRDQVGRTAAVAGVGLLASLLGRPALRIAGLSIAGVLATSALLAPHQLFRPPAALFLLPGLSAVFAGVPALVPEIGFLARVHLQPVLAWPLWALLTWGTVEPAVERYPFTIWHNGDQPDEVRHFAAHWERIGDSVDAGVIGVYPSWYISALRIYLDVPGPPQRPRDHQCGPFEHCFVTDGRMLVGLDTPRPRGLPLDGLVSFDWHSPPEVPGCRLTRSRTNFHLFDCVATY